MFQNIDCFIYLFIFVVYGGPLELSKRNKLNFMTDCELGVWESKFHKAAFDIIFNLLLIITSMSINYSLLTIPQVWNSFLLDISNSSCICTHF